MDGNYLLFVSDEEPVFVYEEVWQVLSAEGEWNRVVDKLPHPVLLLAENGDILWANACWLERKQHTRNFLNCLEANPVMDGYQAFTSFLNGQENSICCELSLWNRHYNLEAYRYYGVVYLILFDISSLKESESASYKLAHTDALTGLLNRRNFDLQGPLLLQTCLKKNDVASLLVIDLNHFKFVNDCYGHQMGDKLLVYVAQRLGRVLRNIDTLWRYGGDEFVAILPGCDEQTVETIVSRCKQVFASHFYVGELKLMVSASIGWAYFPKDGLTLQSLFMLADRAMYQDKQRALTEDSSLYSEQ